MNTEIIKKEGKKPSAVHSNAAIVLVFPALLALLILMFGAGNSKGVATLFFLILIIAHISVSAWGVTLLSRSNRLGYLCFISTFALLFLVFIYLPIHDKTKEDSTRWSDAQVKARLQEIQQIGISEPGAYGVSNKTKQVLQQISVTSDDNDYHNYITEEGFCTSLKLPKSKQYWCVDSTTNGTNNKKCVNGKVFCQ